MSATVAGATGDEVFSLILPAARPTAMGGLDETRPAEPSPVVSLPVVPMSESDRRTAERLTDAEKDEEDAAVAKDPISAEIPAQTPVSGMEAWIRGLTPPENAAGVTAGARGRAVSAAVGTVVPAVVATPPGATAPALIEVGARTESGADRPSGETLVDAAVELPPVNVANDRAVALDGAEFAAVPDAEPEPALPLPPASHLPARIDSAPVAPGDSLPRAQPVQQVADAMLRATEGVTELTLVPEELGPVRIDLSTDRDQLVLAVSAERPETLELLRRSAMQLAAEMRAAGFLQVDLSFGQWSEQGPGQDRPVFIAVADEATPATVAVTQRALPGASLFLRI